MRTREPLTAEHDVVALVREHAGVVWRYAMGLLRDSADADDATQETFLRVHQQLASFAGDASVRTWIVTICREVCLDLRRRRWSEPGRDERADAAGRHDQGPADGVPVLGAIGDGMGGLPDDLRDAFVLVDVLGLSRIEAAEICGIPPTSLRSRLHRAHGRLVDHVMGGADDGL